MKPTPQEKQWLKDYLRQTMAYRETMEEVYDHLLLAAEHQADPQFFKSSIFKIINDDFGGTDGLQLLEENCRREVEASTQKQYFDDFKRWFGSPLMVATVALFALLLFLQYAPSNSGFSLITLFLILLVLPTVIFSIMGFRIGYKYGRSKPSVKEAIFRKITFRVNRILRYTLIAIKIEDLIERYIFKIEHWPNNQALVLNVVYVLVTAMLVSMIIHTLVIIKLLRSEFKTGMVVPIS